MIIFNKLNNYIYNFIKLKKFNEYYYKLTYKNSFIILDYKLFYFKEKKILT